MAYILFICFKSVKMKFVLDSWLNLIMFGGIAGIFALIVFACGMLDIGALNLVLDLKGNFDTRNVA